MPLDGIKQGSREFLAAYSDWVDHVYEKGKELDTVLKHGFSQEDLSAVKELVAEWQMCNKVVLGVIAEIKRIHTEAEKQSSLINVYQKQVEEFLKNKGKYIHSAKTAKGEIHTMINIGARKQVPLEKLANGNFKDPATGKVYNKDGVRISK